MTKFRGDIASLKEIVAACRVRGEWRFIERNGLHQFQAATGESLNWWPSTGTIMFQGGKKPILATRFGHQIAAQ